MRIKFKIVLAVLLLTVILTGHASAKITLTYNQYFPPTHMASQLSDAWCKEIEKRTNGEVQFQHYAGGQLLKAPQVFDGVVRGIADVGFSNLAYTRGLFPEMEICDLPLGMPSAWVATHVANAYYTKYQPKEFDKVKVMNFSACGPNLISTKDKPVNNLQDLKGQTLRATGRIADTATALGATPRPMEIGETFEAVNRSVVSGVMLPLETMKGFRLGDLLKYCTADWQVGNVYTFYAVMNKDKWNALPENIKKVFDEVNSEWIEKMAQGWNDIDRSGAEYFKSKGGRIIQLSNEEAALWTKTVEPVVETYVKEMAAKGLSAEELNARRAFIYQIRDAKMKEQQMKGIPMPYAE
ncbi:MAG: TRAP transporter substrate-binding protein [Pseudomonadota bacterium]